MWRLVSQKEMEAVLTTDDPDAYGGLMANVSYLISDPNFDHDRDTEFAKWTVTSTATSSDGGTIYDWPNVSTINGRLPYGYSVATENQKKYTVKNGNMIPDLSNSSTTLTPWDQAIFRKLQVDTRDGGPYAFGAFEGVGTASQSFTAPADGAYIIQCIAFRHGNTAKIFAKVSGEATSNTTEENATATGTDVSKDLPELKDASFVPCTQAANVNTAGYYPVTVSSTTQWLNLGKYILENANSYTVNVIVKAKKGQTVTFGLQKDQATKSKVAYKSGNTEYYFDTDYAVIDNIQVSYIGSDAMILDETRDDIDYMKYEHRNKPVILKRTFALNQWNAIVLPLNLTMAQFQSAFGDDAELAKLDGVGTISNAQNTIDFKTVTITSDGNAIEAGKYYLVKPTKASTQLQYTTTGGVEVNDKFYILGRRSFDWTSTVPSFSTTYKGENTSNPFNKEVVCTGLYAQTSAPAKSYIFYGGDMYHLTSAYNYKGFRFYLTDVTPTSTTTTQEMKMTIDGKGNGTTGIEAATIEPATRMGNNVVYTIDGKAVKVWDGTLNDLTKGVYILNGKKIVK